MTVYGRFEKRDRVFGVVAAYSLVAALSLGCALWWSLSHLPESMAQEPPSAPAAPTGEVPPPEVPGTEVSQDGAVGESEDTNSLTQSFLEPFIYEAEGRRDPFKPPSDDETTIGEVSGPFLPLQRYDLKDLVLIGIIWGVKEPKAMFLDPNKQVHTLGIDDRIGRNNGYIAVIREGEVVVVETVEVRGELAYTTQVMKMSR